MNNKLTAKQEKFAINIAKGMTQSDAYRDAYDAENMKDEVIYVKASELAADGKIKVRIDYLRDYIVNYTMEQHMKELEEAKMMAQQQDNVQGVIKATELKGKVKGLYVQKVETKDTSEHENWLDQLEE